MFATIHGELKMLAKDLISETIMPLRTSDTGHDALRVMEEFKVSHYPIVNNVDFLGLISEDDIYSFNDPSSPLGAHLLSLAKPYVFQYQHVFDVLIAFSELHVTLLPVVDQSNRYVGSILPVELIRNYAMAAAIMNPGGIIILEMNITDYSMNEISRIIESNDAKILNLFVTTYPDSTKVQVTIKINKINIQAIIQTFNRYNYLITASYTEDNFNDDLKDRYDSLMNYLSI